MPKKPSKIKAQLEQFQVGNRVFSLQEVGPLTRETRKKRGDTLEKLADMLNLSIAGLSRIETGKHLPNGALMTQLLRYVFPGEALRLSEKSILARYEPAGFKTLLNGLLEQEGLDAADRAYVVGMVESFVAYRRALAIPKKEKR